MLRIKAERLRRGWNQTRLAYQSDLSGPDVSRIETGRTRPYPKQLQRLAKVLNLSPDSLMQEIGEPSEETVMLPVSNADENSIGAAVRDAVAVPAEPLHTGLEVPCCIPESDSGAGRRDGNVSSALSTATARGPRTPAERRGGSSAAIGRSLRRRPKKIATRMAKSDA